MLIKLVRHGESEANVGMVDTCQVGDHTVVLTEKGHQQAKEAGATIGSDFLTGALIFSSPYQRAQQTMQGVLAGAGVAPDTVRCYEDPRIREVEHGYTDAGSQQDLRKTHGWFYYRYAGGESPADCFDRTSSFLESMMRQVSRKQVDRVLIVTHGITLRCFVMRFMHLTVAQYESMRNPNNGDIVTIGNKSKLERPVFTTDYWGVSGLQLWKAEEQ